jgi:transcriptional regulator with XRE-family HTH domain
VAGDETAGERLKRLRREAGLSQSQLARAAGVPIGTLRNWEQNRRVPLLDTAARVARAIGVSLDELAGQPEAASPPQGKAAPSMPPRVELEARADRPGRALPKLRRRERKRGHT